MSRIIVKNLPKKFTEESLRDLFGKKGELTDVQLKFKNGKFRQFAFLGYKTDEEARAAIQFFDGTFVNTSKIKVDLCNNLSDPNKPRAWSKYSKDSSAFQKSQQESPETVQDESKEKKKTSKEKPVVLSEALEKVKDDPEFAEFLEVHKNRSNKTIWGNDAGDMPAVEAHATPIKGKKAKSGATNGQKALSDLEYLKSKVAKDESAKESGEDVENGNESVEPTKKKVKKKEKRINTKFTLKMIGQSFTCKKPQIKQFFDPIIPTCIFQPRWIRGVAFIDFKSETDVNQALILRQRGFLGANRVLLKRHRKKEDSLKNGKEGSVWTKSGCMFLRNLPYTVTEEDLENLFKPFGPLASVRLPIERVSRKIKGFAFIDFLMPEHAARAHAELDGTVFQGRNLHILPAKTKLNENGDAAAAGEGGTYKQKKASEEKAQSGSSHNWNALFLGANAVADVVARKYDTSKQELLNPESSESMAVRMALGETQIVIETRNFLLANGVELDAFSQAASERSKTVILVKNLTADVSVDELRQVFAKYGEVGRVIFPPSGITAVVEFLTPTEAKRAFQNLAYTKFHHIPLFLEWAPMKIFKSAPAAGAEEPIPEMEAKSQEAEKEVEEEQEEEEEPEEDTTLFVKNLSLETTEDMLRTHFEQRKKPLHSVSVSKKMDVQNPGNLVSLGYGFVQFMHQSDAKWAMKHLQRSSLDGHVLELKISHRTVSTEKVRRKSKSPKVTKQKSTKILVRNIPFEATDKEVAKLFSTFGEFKALRLPKKTSSGSHRGFGFVDFLTRSDAKRAFEALCHSTHLYGRRLVLEWAETDDVSVDSLRRKTAEHYHEGAPAPKKLRKNAILEQLGAADESE